MRCGKVVMVDENVKSG